MNVLFPEHTMYEPEATESAQKRGVCVVKIFCVQECPRSSTCTQPTNVSRTAYTLFGFREAWGWSSYENTIGSFTIFSIR